MTHKLSILLVEDEKNICDFISTSLSAQDYRISTAHTGKEALPIITSQCPDLILLDLGLPDMDGMEIIRQVRTWSSIPIIVLSARTQEQEKVRALDLGADDYLTKPIGTSELLARIRTALRHSNRLNTDSPLYKRPFHAKGLTIDFEKHLVSVDGKDVHLTQIEFKIISLLAQNSGRVMTYDTIISNIWGPYADDDNSILRVNMAHIRRKLEQNPAEPQYVFTEIGIGYRMIEDEMQ
ncbi:response regulator [Clostridium sp.]|uniref:response regulator n=2 Tax=Clostridium TaxID=1485 RepID=UPI0025F5BF44|nr:response regulator [uncultured Clostridium sp.]